MPTPEQLAEQFEAHRAHLRAVASIGCSGRRVKQRMQSRRAGFDSAGPM